MRSNDNCKSVKQARKRAMRPVNDLLKQFAESVPNDASASTLAEEAAVYCVMAQVYQQLCDELTALANQQP
jgi:hypothetical protein